jgi:hypothetical protein
MQQKTLYSLNKTFPEDIMETTNTTLDLELLTQAEKDYILAKRQREAAEKTEQDAARKVKISKKIADMNQQAAAFKTKQDDKERATRSFFNDFIYNMLDGFTLVEKLAENTFKAETHTDRENIIHETKTIEYKTFKIISKDQITEKTDWNQIYIDVVWSEDHNWSRTRDINPDNAGWRLQIHGITGDERQYKKAKTCIEKINQFIADHRRTVTGLNNALSLQDRALAAAKITFPDAINYEKFEDTRFYNTGRNGRHTSSTRSSTTRWITLTYANGYVVSYTFEESPTDIGFIKKNLIKFKFFRMDISKLDETTLVNFLKTAPAKTL